VVAPNDTAIHIRSGVLHKWLLRTPSAYPTRDSIEMPVCGGSPYRSLISTPPVRLHRHFPCIGALVESVGKDGDRGHDEKNPSEFGRRETAALGSAHQRALPSFGRDDLRQGSPRPIGQPPPQLITSGPSQHRQYGGFSYTGVSLPEPGFSGRTHRRSSCRGPMDKFTCLVS